MARLLYHESMILTRSIETMNNDAYDGTVLYCILYKLTQVTLLDDVIYMLQKAAIPVDIELNQRY